MSQTYDEAMAELQDIWNRYGWPSDEVVKETQRLVAEQVVAAPDAERPS